MLRVLASKRAYRVLFLIALATALSLAAISTATPPTTLDVVFVSTSRPDVDSTLIGDYRQPEWTTRRPFVNTRIYVQPAGQVELEVGYDWANLPDSNKTHLYRQELEIGLTRRFQVDVENVFQDFSDEDKGKRSLHRASNSLELRYAFADWGKMPLNPTVNIERRFTLGRAGTNEIQLLLGAELSARWRWGMNIFFEQQTGDDRVREEAASQAFSYSLADSMLSVGAEMKYSLESDKDSRGAPERRFAIGPSIQWRPVERTHLDLVLMRGAARAAARWELFLFFGFEFGKGSGKQSEERLDPASLRGK